MKQLVAIAWMIASVVAGAQGKPAITHYPNTGSEIYSGIITGQIKTVDGLPAAFVTVYVKGTNHAAITDEIGSFTIKNLKEGNYTLEISMIGLRSQYKMVEIKKDQLTTIEIILAEDEKQLSEVVITSGRRLNNKPVSIGKIEINPMDLPQSLTVIGFGLSQ